MVREVFVYPLHRDWRQLLTAENAPQTHKSNRKGVPSMNQSKQAMYDMKDELVKKRYDMMSPFLDEKQRRLFAGTEANNYGTGGLKRVAALLKMSQSTVKRGMEEVKNPETVEPDRIRKPGGGRKTSAELDPELIGDLEKLISPKTRGDPQ